MRYLSQRYSMPYREVAGLLTDIGTEELGHLEMVSTMVHQLTRNLTMEQIKGTPFEAYYLIIRLEYGHRLQEVYLSVQLNSSQRGMQ